jgi:phytanoyl-CoA hydroxylase
MQTETHDALCPAPSDPAAFTEFFQREGSMLLRGALPPAVCAEAVDGFLKEVHLDTRTLFMRNAAARYQPHAYTEAGRMRVPIVDLQQLCGRRYPQFKAAGLALFTDPVLRNAIETLLGEPALLVRTMYADGNHDSDADDDDGAATIGALIAAEDSEPRAGYPAAPVLKQGDLLLWNAIAATPPPCSCRAFIGHYTARSARLPRRATSTMLGGMEVVLHGDRRSLAGRAAHLLRSAYPRLYTLLRASRPA